LAAALIGLPGGRGWERAQFQALRTQLAFAFGYRAELERRAGGNPSSNAGADYASLLRRPEVVALYGAAGLDLRADLARLAAAPRIPASARARAYLERNAVLNGKLGAPLLTLHTTADWVVPVQNEHAFAAVAAGPLLRQLYVRRAGHCAFTDAEMLTALDVLFTRIDSGRWPGASPALLNAAAGRLGPAYAGFAASRAVPLKAPAAFTAIPGAGSRTREAWSIRP
jgi:pimeloyl-ACP methyl ester carboxylesterase